MLFHHRSTKSFRRFHPDLRTVAPRFWKSFKINIRNSKKSKNKKHSHCIMLFDLIASNNNKLGILIFFRKSVSKTELSCMRFLAFNLSYQWYGHNHDIVCSDDPVLCESVRLGMTNNVAEASFHFFFARKSHFSFFECHNQYFCKGATKIQFYNWTKTISKYNRPLRV
jgi:hypothetical protein